VNTVKKLRFSFKTGHSFCELNDCKIGKHVSSPWSQMFETVANVECVYWSNTTIFIGRIQSFFLRRVQLHVSVLCNGYLQVVHEIIIKQLYKTYMGCLYGVGRG